MNSNPNEGNAQDTYDKLCNSDIDKDLELEQLYWNDLERYHT